MVITFPRSLPSELLIQQVRMKKIDKVAVAESTFTGEQQVQEHQGQWWAADVSTPPIPQADDAAVVAAFLTSLRGPSKTLLFGDPARVTARGSASTTPGTPLVNGAGQTGDQLICDGAPNGVTGYLKTGDYVQLGSGNTSKLHMVLEDINTDGSGNFTLTLWPDLRSSPTDDDALVVDDARGVFRLVGQEMGWDEQTVIYGFSFEIREAL